MELGTTELLITFIAMTGNFLWLLFENSKLKVMIQMQSAILSTILKYNPELMKNVVDKLKEEKNDSVETEKVAKEMNEIWKDRINSMKPAKSK